MILKPYKIVRTLSHKITMKRYVLDILKGQCFGCKAKGELCNKLLSYNIPIRIVEVCYKYYDRQMTKFTYKVESCVKEKI